MIMSFQHSHNLQETNIRLSPTMIANRKHENLHVFLRLEFRLIGQVFFEHTNQHPLTTHPPQFEVSLERPQPSEARSSLSISFVPGFTTLFSM